MIKIWNLDYLKHFLQFTHHTPMNSNSIFIVNPNLKFLFKEAECQQRMCCGKTAAHSLTFQ